MTTKDVDRCDGHGCERRLTGTTITTRDGRRYCKRCADRLPRYLRKPPRVKVKA
jgi:hypothetical protein